MPSYSSDIKMYLDERDLNTLRNPTNHISARVVNFFLWNIANQLTESRSWFGRAADGEDGICFLPSTVWSHFKSNSKCELVAYTRRNPFESGHIAIPFFEQDHWMLLVVAFAYHVNGGKDAIAEDEARTTAILFDPSTDKVAETTTIRATAIRLLKALAPKRQVRIGLLDRLKLEHADIVRTTLQSSFKLPLLTRPILHRHPHRSKIVRRVPRMTAGSSAAATSFDISSASREIGSTSSTKYWYVPDAWTSSAANILLK